MEPRRPGQAPPTTTPRTLTPKQAAHEIGATEYLIRRLANEGKVPHLRMGRRKLMFLPEHLEAILDALTVRMKEVQQASLDSSTDLDALGGTDRSRAMRR